MLKEIPDFKGYFASDNGKIYCNLGRGNRNKNKPVDMYVVQPRKTKNGYTRVYMRQTSTNKRVDRYVHRIIATLFVSNPSSKKQVNHKNCIRNDNRADNLEWCTSKENNNFTIQNNHVLRDKLGRYVSNFDYKEILL